MSANTLNLPRHRDPIARLTLVGLIVVVTWIGITQPTPQSTSAQEPIIVLATPALRQLPTSSLASVQDLATPAQPQPTAAPQPGVELAAPTIDPAQLAQQQPTAPPPEHVIVERVVEVRQIIVATPTAEMAPPPEDEQQATSGGFATPGPGDRGFADSFATPDPAAKCQFIGCLNP